MNRRRDQSPSPGQAWQRRCADHRWVAAGRRHAFQQATNKKSDDPLLRPYSLTQGAQVLGYTRSGTAAA